ncbi:MAG: RHS repeat protein [Planctomycetes bacterium]|nr:RHS repeat protein [Planctomycetota bacterium]
MKRVNWSVLSVAASLGFALSAWAEDAQTYREQTAGNPMVTCSNPAGGSGWIPGYPPPVDKPTGPEPFGPYETGAPGTECYSCKTATMNGATVPNKLGSTFWGSTFCDSLSYNFVHMAQDYAETTPTSAAGCTSCGGSANLPASPHGFSLLRLQRSRDMTEYSSLGPGAFLNYDTKLYLYVQNGSNIIELLDPQAVNHSRFVDGPITHVFGISDPLDGTYVAYKNNSHQEIKLLDALGQLTTSQANAASAVLTGWSGQKLTFEIINVAGALAGRLVKIEDTTGYAFTIAYRYPAAPGNGDLQWQIYTVSSPRNEVATFSYLPAQVSGRWVVSQVDLPNNTSLAYSYADGFLAGVQYPDGTAATFARSFDSVSNCVQVAISDAGARPESRNETAFLTTNYTVCVDLPDDNFPQAANLVRLVLNGSGERLYQNVPRPDGVTMAYIFEGNNTLKRIYCGWEEHYATSFSWTQGAGGWAYDGIAASLEATFLNLEYSSANGYKKWYYAQPDAKTDETGRRRTYAYDSAGYILSKTFPDATTETWLYNNLHEITQYKDRLDRVTTYAYSPQGNLLSKTTGLVMVGGVPTATLETATWTWEYFPAGDPNQYLLSASVDALGNRTEYFWDSNHRLVKIKEPADNTGDPRAETLLAWDAAGRLVSVTDPELRVTTHEYDARNRVLKITYNDATFETLAYGSGADANLLVSQADRLGNTTTHAFDASGREVQRVTAANDPANAATFACTYRIGTSLHDTCTDRGNATTYTYDYRNRQKTRVVQPNRSLTGGAAKLLTTTTTYTNNLVSSVTDEYSRKTYFVYASADPYVIRTVRDTVPSGATGTIATLARDASLNAKYIVEDMTVDAEGQVLTRVDGRNIEHQMFYDSRGRTTATVESARQWDDGTAQFVVTGLGARTEFSYDAQGNRTQVKRPRSFQQQGDGSFVAGSEGDFITKYTYTGRNLAKSTTEAFGRSEAATESYTYYLDRRTKDRIDARGNTWTTLWSKCCGYHKVDASPAADVDDNSGTPTTRAAYVGNRDSRNLVVHQYTVPDWSLYPQDPTLPDSIYHDPTVTLNETTTRYDARMRPIASTQWFIDLGNVDKNDPPIAGDHGTNATDGLTTHWVYDENLTDGVGLDAAYATQLATLGTTYFGAGSVGSAVEVTNPAGEKSVAVFDGLGRTVLSIDGNLNTRRIVYDAVVGGTTGAQGNVVETTFYDGLSHTNKQRVDGAERTLSTVDGESRVSAYSFDANSNQVKGRDPNGVGMDCVFDARNRQTQCTDTLSVDGTGAATGDMTKYAFDNHNNLKTTTDAKTHITTCSYDGRDRKTACTNRVSGTTAWAYDANSNLLTLTDAQSSATTYVYDPRNLRVTNDVFAYDNASRLADATSGRYSNLVHRAYDAGGRMTSEALTIGSQTFTTTSAYDAANRRTSITYPNGKVVAQTFTNRDQLSNVKYDAVNVATLAYDLGMRKVTDTFGNGKVETRTYRGDNRASTIAIPTGITNFAYSWDVNKNKTEENDTALPTNVQDYTYDNEDRLTGFARNSGQTQAWTLSLVGDWSAFNDNGSSQTRTHNAVHELTDINSTSLTYDLKGNLTANSNGQSYTWDFENCMKTAVVGADTATYQYDAFRRRVKKSFQGNSTIFAYDGWRSIAEYDGGAAPSSASRVFVFSTYLDEPLMMLVGSTKYYFHSNDLYSTATLTNSAGTVVDRMKFDPYGKVTVLDASGTAKSDPNNSEYGNPYLFQGQRVDKETGLGQWKLRYYDYALGRFLNRNPWGYAHDFPNLYDFVDDQPTDWLEPMSKKTPSQWEKEIIDWIAKMKGEGKFTELQDMLDRKVWIIKANPNFIDANGATTPYSTETPPGAEGEGWNTTKKPDLALTIIAQVLNDPDVAKCPEVVFANLIHEGTHALQVTSLNYEKYYPYNKAGFKAWVEVQAYEREMLYFVSVSQSSDPCNKCKCKWLLKWYLDSKDYVDEFKAWMKKNPGKPTFLTIAPAHADQELGVDWDPDPDHGLTRMGEILAKECPDEAKKAGVTTK